MHHSPTPGHTAASCILFSLVSTYKMVVVILVNKDGRELGTLPSCTAGCIPEDPTDN